MNWRQTWLFDGHLMRNWRSMDPWYWFVNDGSNISRILHEVGTHPNLVLATMGVAVTRSNHVGFCQYSAWTYWHLRRKAKYFDCQEAKSRLLWDKPISNQASLSAFPEVLHLSWHQLRYPECWFGVLSVSDWFGLLETVSDCFSDFGLLHFVAISQHK